MMRSSRLVGLAMLVGVSPAAAHGVALDPVLRFTFTIEAGKATKVTLLQGGATIEGPRVP